MLKKILLFFWILIAVVWSAPTYFDLIMVERGANYWVETAGLFALLGLPIGFLHRRKIRVNICVLMTLLGPGFIVMMNPSSFLRFQVFFTLSLFFVFICFFTGSEFLFFTKHRYLKFRLKHRKN